MSALRRLRDDLSRPAGGWTTGILTLMGAITFSLASFHPVWPLGGLIAEALGLLCLAAHLLWGSAGYYPRTM